MAKKKTGRNSTLIKQPKNKKPKKKPNLLANSSVWHVKVARIHPSAVDLTTPQAVPPSRPTVQKHGNELHRQFASKVDIGKAYLDLLNSGPINAVNATDAAQQALYRFQGYLNSNRVSISATSTDYAVAVQNATYRPIDTGAHETAAWIMEQDPTTGIQTPLQFSVPVIMPDYTVYCCVLITVAQ